VFLGLGVLVLAALLLIGYLVFGGRNDPSGPGGQTTTLTTAETSRPATGSVPSELLPTMIDPSLVSSIPGLSLPVQTSG